MKDSIFEEFLGNILLWKCLTIQKSWKKFTVNIHISTTITTSLCPSMNPPSYFWTYLKVSCRHHYHSPPPPPAQYFGLYSITRIQSSCFIILFLGKMCISIKCIDLKFTFPWVLTMFTFVLLKSVSPQKIPSQPFPANPQPSSATQSKSLLVLELHFNRIIHYILFCVKFLSHSVMFLRLLCSWVYQERISISHWVMLYYINIPPFIDSSMDGHLCSFQVWLL